MGNFEKEIELFRENKMAPMAYTYIMQNIYNWYGAESIAERTMIEAKLEAFRKTGYTKTGIDKYDKLIEEMPKRPVLIIGEDNHFLRNSFNIEFSWENFEKKMRDCLKNIDGNRCQNLVRAFIRIQLKKKSRIGNMCHLTDILKRCIRLMAYC